MKIFLIGFMGCGKSTLGRKLATRLGYTLIDLDQQIEKITKSTVADYFAANGEDAFRQLESSTLKEYVYPANSIIATGGGTPCYFDNMDWMNANGLTIYIEMKPYALAKRLEQGIAKRPLLSNLTEEGIIAFIENKLAERNPFYSRAAVTISGVNLTAEHLHAIVMEKN
jgi:shikimate kinase